MIVKLREGMLVEINGISTVESLIYYGEPKLKIVYRDKNIDDRYISCNSSEESLELCEKLYNEIKNSKKIKVF